MAADSNRGGDSGATHSVCIQCHHEAHYFMLTKTIKIEMYSPKKIENANSVYFLNVFTLELFFHFLIHTFIL